MGARDRYTASLEKLSPAATLCVLVRAFLHVHSQAGIFQVGIREQKPRVAVLQLEYAILRDHGVTCRRRDNNLGSLEDRS